MLDTVVLHIPISRVTIGRPEIWSPNADKVLETSVTHGVLKSYLNPTKNDGMYMPRLTIVNRLRGRELRIEFSAPKLVYGNNFEELDENDLEQIISTLHNRLKLRSVHVSHEDLLRANVVTFHFGKNVMFDDHTLASSMIQLFGRANYTTRFDLRQTDYQNGGKLMRLHSKSMQIVMYDKIDDLTKSKDRATEKDDREHNLQFQFFKDIRKEKRPIEIVRLEMRLLNKTRMKTIFTQLGLAHDFTLRGFMRRKVWHALIDKYWNELFSELGPVLISDLTPDEQFDFIMRGGIVKPSVAVKLMGMIYMQQGDQRRIREIFEKNASIRTFYRHHKHLIDNLNPKTLRNEPLERMERQIRELVPLRKEDLKAGDEILM